MITRGDGKPFKLVGHNEKTRLFAVVWSDDSEYVTMYREKPVKGWGDPWEAVRIICRVGDEGRTMYRYGKSKTMHYSKKCAKPNTDREPEEVSILEGMLAGLRPCRNCWERTHHR